MKTLRTSNSNMLKRTSSLRNRSRKMARKDPSLDQEEPDPPQIEVELEEEEPQPGQIKMEEEEIEPQWVKEEQEELEHPQIKEEEENREPPQIKEEDEELESPPIKEEEEGLEPPQIKKKEDELEQPQIEESEELHLDNRDQTVSQEDAGRFQEDRSDRHDEHVNDSGNPVSQSRIDTAGGAMADGGEHHAPDVGSDPSRAEGSRKTEDALIIAVCGRPELYDPESYYYRDKNKRDIAWRRIAEEIGQPEDVCRLKWKVLLDTYLRERRMEMENRSEAAAGNVTRWRFSAILGFLDPFITIPATSGSTGQVIETAGDLPGPAQDQDTWEASETEEPQVPGASESPVPGPCPPAVAPQLTAVRRNRERTREESTVLERSPLIPLRTRPEPTPPRYSPTELWLLSLAPSIDKLPLRQKALLQLKILNLINEYGNPPK